MRNLKKFARLLSVQWSIVLQYRTDAIFWMLAESTIPLVSLAIWIVVSRNSATGPQPTEIFTYYIAVIFIKIMTDAWNGAFLARDILQGEIVKDLIRPIPAVWRHIAESLTEKAFKIILPISLLAILLIVYPQNFSPEIFQLSRLALFAISLLIASMLQFTVDHIIGMLAFWLEDAFQIRRYKVMLESLASGVLIPFAFMPPLAVHILSILPMRYFISAPAEILLNKPVGFSISQLLAIQIAWLTGSVVLATYVWRKGLRRYAIPGQ